MTSDQIRGWLIIIGLSVLATVFFNQSQQIAGIGALTVAAAMWSLDQFGLISLGGFEVPIVLLGLIGAGVALYAWQESKRYYL